VAAGLPTLFDCLANRRVRINGAGGGGPDRNDLGADPANVCCHPTGVATHARQVVGHHAETGIRAPELEQHTAKQGSVDDE
jgi:hypothetical protein